MSPATATAVYLLVILVLFWLDRDQKVQTSVALWIPVIWMSLACSRSVAQWLNEPADIEVRISEGSPLDRLVYMGLEVLGLMVLLNRRKQVGKLLRANAPVILFFLYCALSLLWSDYPDVGFKRWIKALGDLIMVLVVWSDREPSASCKRLLTRTGFLLIPLSVLFIKYYPDLARTFDKWDGHAYYIGVTMSKNTLGAICLLFGLGSAWRFLAAYQDKVDRGRTRRLIAHGTILAMVVWLFWMANSKTSLSCFLLGSGLLLAMNSRSVLRRPAVLNVLVAVVILVCVSVLFLGLGSGLLKIMGRNPTLTDRTEIWPLLLSMSSNSLVGTGFESFWVGPRLDRIWSVYPWQPLEAHNGYIEVLLNLGWIGVGLLAIVIAMGYRTVITAWRRNPAASSLWVAYFVAGVVFNFTEAAFFRIMTPTWICFLLAITNGVEVTYPSVETSAREFPRFQNAVDVPGNKVNVNVVA